jgi:hypothetical protein
MPQAEGRHPLPGQVGGVGRLAVNKKFPTAATLPTMLPMPQPPQ